MRLTRWTVVILLALGIVAGWAVTALAGRQPELTVRCTDARGREVFMMEPISWITWRFVFDPPQERIVGACRITY